MRVGNEEYARSNKSFGLTTLKDRHVDIRPSEVRFHFRGKSGVMHDVAVHDRAVARIVRRCRDLPGQELFQYLGEDGQPATIDSADVNEYIREATGHDFTAKDFRTWAGTVLAALALQEVDAAAELLAGRGRSRAHKAGARKPTPRDVSRAIEKVAQRLGNTPAVCRKCYVHPDVIAAYLDGTLSSSFGPSRRGAAGVAAARRVATRRGGRAGPAAAAAWPKTSGAIGWRPSFAARCGRSARRQRGRRWRSTA